MRIVDDEHDLVGDGLDHLVRQCRDLIGRPAGEGQAGAEAGDALAQPRGDVSEKKLRGLETLVARAPRDPPPAPRDELGEQRRLPVAGACDQRHGASEEAGEGTVHELVAWETVRRKARGDEARA
jgi:hypothetical protein